jgi:hypothetical protein
MFTYDLSTTLTPEQAFEILTEATKIDPSVHMQIIYRLSYLDFVAVEKFIERKEKELFNEKP